MEAYLLFATVSPAIGQHLQQSFGQEWRNVANADTDSVAHHAKAIA